MYENVNKSNFIFSKAVGPKPILNLPDELVIPKAPLKVESSYLLTVCNIGAVPAGFTLDAKWYEHNY